MYWTEFGSSVFRANLDGSGVETFASDYTILNSHPGGRLRAAAHGDAHRDQHTDPDADAHQHADATPTPTHTPTRTPTFTPTATPTRSGPTATPSGDFYSKSLFWARNSTGQVLTAGSMARGRGSIRRRARCWPTRPTTARLAASRSIRSTTSSTGPSATTAASCARQPGRLEPVRWSSAAWTCRGRWSSIRPATGSSGSPAPTSSPTTWTRWPGRLAWSSPAPSAAWPSTPERRPALLRLRRHHLPAQRQFREHTAGSRLGRGRLGQQHHHRRPQRATSTGRRAARSTSSAPT